MEPAKPQASEPGKSDMWLRGSRLLAGLIVALFMFGCLLVLRPQLRKLKTLAAKNKALQETRDSESESLRELREELLWLRTDLTYLETVARDRLGRAKPGEYVVRVRSKKAE